MQCISDPFQLNMIEEALNEYHKKTCIKFVYRTSEPDYISIENSQTGCWSSVGRVGGKQVVNLQVPGCLNKVGTAIHELLHAVGFLHEQNRSDRDEYVFIQWYNIPQSKFLPLLGSTSCRGHDLSKCTFPQFQQIFRSSHP
jgi:hypothetical protein